MQVVLGDITSLFTRSVYQFIGKLPIWMRKKPIPGGVKEELNFWMNNVQTLNRRQLYPSSAPVRVEVKAASNASSVACVAHIKLGSKLHVAHKNLSTEQKERSSTRRELNAINHGIESFAPLIRGRSIAWETDNQAVPIIVKKGSKKADLQAEAMRLFYTCRTSGIHLHINWKPREENEFADQISKYIDYDDWKMSRRLFEILDGIWGPHSIDRFANTKNTHTRRSNARYWSPGCEAVDAFTQDWSKDINWLVPPVYLAPKVIRHAEACRATGTLIIPQWHSAPYWPLLFDNQKMYWKGIIGTKVFSDPKDLPELGGYDDSLLGSSGFNSPLLAITISF